MEGSRRKPSANGATRPLARIVAPLALIAAAVVVIVVVSNSMGDGAEGGGETTRTDQPRKEATKDGPKRRTYVVESGDSLSAIADRFGLTVEEILELNEDVDPQALVTGQELKLK